MLEGAGHSLAEAGIDSKGASLRTANLTRDRKGGKQNAVMAQCGRAAATPLPLERIHPITAPEICVRMLLMTSAS